MTTTNKLVSLESIMEIVSNFAINSKFLTEISNEIQSLPTYSEPTKGSNHTILQEYIDEYSNLYNREFYGTDMVKILQEIQSRLTEGTEYEDDKEYEFSDDGKEWRVRSLSGYKTGYNGTYARHIRPISPIPPELTQAMEVLEKAGYTITKN